MASNIDNKIRIDEYIGSNPDSKLETKFPISLKGVKKVLDVYRLPTEMLFYNIRNGRFAAEYKELVRNEGGDLRSENKNDANKIKNLLLDLDIIETKRTLDDLNVRGQWNCGIITNDGYVIDGNRRMAIISKLYNETGFEKWKYLDVARLGEPVTPENLWALEAGIQLGKNEIVKYGPINELLKIREGHKAGLSIQTIVNTLYGSDEDEIVNKLSRLDLIEQYLTFIGTPEKYSVAKNRVEHFINLQNIIIICEKYDYTPDKIIKIKRVAFQLIKENIPHLELRKIQHMIKKDLTDAISEIEIAALPLKPITPHKASPDEIIKDDTKIIMDEFEENPENMSLTYTHFINAMDILDVSNNEDKEILLLGRAEKNLKPLLDYPSDKLSTPEAISLIKKIVRYVDALNKNIGD